MLKTRVIPCLQLAGESLVKTIKFGNHGYVGDPINTVRIFNELEVDELCLLDIRATVENRRPDVKLLSQIAEECFMPLSYGGGVGDVPTAREILRIGFEKVVVNSSAVEEPELVSRLADRIGSQAVLVSIDVKRSYLGGYHVYSHDGTRRTAIDPVEWAIRLQNLGAGELLLTSMDREGTWSGFDLEIVRRVAQAVVIPVISSGGAGSVEDIVKVVKVSGASAVALGNMVVYQQRNMGVLVNFPDRSVLEASLGA